MTSSNPSAGGLGQLDGRDVLSAQPVRTHAGSWRAPRGHRIRLNWPSDFSSCLL